MELEPPKQKRSVDGFRMALATWNVKFDLLAEGALDAVADETFRLAEAALNISQRAARLRGWGDALSAEDKRAMGLPVRQVIGRRFIESLSDKGKMDIAESARALANVGEHQFQQDIQHSLVRWDECSGAFEIPDDEHCCKAARDLRGGAMDAVDLPYFPLLACDRWTCRCRVSRYSERLHGFIPNAVSVEARQQMNEIQSTIHKRGEASVKSQIPTPKVKANAQKNGCAILALIILAVVIWLAAH